MTFPQRIVSLKLQFPQAFKILTVKISAPWSLNILARESYLKNWSNIRFKRYFL